MVPPDLPTIEKFFASLPGVRGFSVVAHILLGAYYLRQTGRTDFSSSELAEAFKQATLPPFPRLKDRLAKLAKGKKARLIRIQPGRYSLSIHGLEEVKRYLADKPVSHESLAVLEKAVGRVSDETERKFLAEAVACVQVDAKRAVIVMTWLLAIHHLQEYVFQAKLNDFNNALKRRGDTKNLVIRKKDDFGDLKESVFIEVARSARVISNDVRKILDEKLGIRNSCAHPSDIEIHASKVQNFIEDLVDNVIRKYAI